MEHWQGSMLADLQSNLERNEDVLGLLLFGSCSKPESVCDAWSDSDILIVVKNFEGLAVEWSSEYQENRQFLLSWTEKARTELRRQKSGEVSPVTGFSDF